MPYTIPGYFEWKKEKMNKKQILKIQKEKRIQFEKKLEKAKVLIPKIREQIDLIHSFLFDLRRKPEEVDNTEKLIEELLKKMPRFTQDEQHGFLTEEYDIVKKYWLCLYCKRDLHDFIRDNENTKERIVCNDCGITYWIQEKKPKKKLDYGQELSGGEDELLFGDTESVTDTPELVSRAVEQPLAPELPLTDPVEIGSNHHIDLESFGNSPTWTSPGYPGWHYQTPVEVAPDAEPEPPDDDPI